jgi:signal transduction histidine kinase
LYIAKQMAEAHKGGKLWAESEGEGRGSQFYVEIDFVK